MRKTMSSIRKALPLFQFACGAILLLAFIIPASAQTNPCGAPSVSQAPITVTGLTPVDSGRIVSVANLVERVHDFWAKLFKQFPQLG